MKIGPPPYSTFWNICNCLIDRQSILNQSLLKIDCVEVDTYFSILILLFMENYDLSIHMAFCKESMINWLSNLINRNRLAAKISQVLCSSDHPPFAGVDEIV